MPNTRLLIIVLMILATTASRLIPHPINFTPLTAIALFGGAYFADKRWAFLVPVGALLLSDLVLVGLYALMPVVYGSFALIVCIGFWLRKRRQTLPVLGAALTSSVLFFLLTNFAVWTLGGCGWIEAPIFPKTLSGLTACYLTAIPSFRNALIGDMVYTVLLFGGFALAEKLFPILRAPVFGGTE